MVTPLHLPQTILLSLIALSFTSCQTSPVTYRFETDEKLVALTIDDGPDPATTAALLDTLDSHGAKATFFILGSKVEGNEALLRRMVDGGHEIGNHTMRDRPSVLLTTRALKEDMAVTHQLLSKFGAVRWFRPGSGFYTRRTLRVAGSQGYRTALADVIPFDWAIPAATANAKYLRQRIRPGSIIVLHDGGGRGGRTIKTLRRLLPDLRSAGFRVMSLSDLAARVNG